MKSVLIVDRDLPLGLIANTAAALGLSLGDRIKGLTGPDITDPAGNVHLGVTNIPIPVLGTSKEKIKEIADSLYSNPLPDVTAIDFNSVAQRCNSYDTYIVNLQDTPPESVQYLGLCLYGPDKVVNKLTGQLALLR